jgi:crotonobetainyl-CoA:carnitine CoA-transferase CaiB-like acyl-CoA transferase
LVAPYGVHRARDRALNITCASTRQWQALCQALGAAEIIHDARFLIPAGRVRTAPS